MSKVSSLVNEIMSSGLTTSGKEWLELSALVNSKPEEYKLSFIRAKNFVNYLKTKIKLVGADQQITLIDLLDYIMVEGRTPLHTQVATKDFISVLIGLIKSKDNPEIQVKILYLIKKWGVRFENQKDILPNFFETYSALKKSNVIFPDKMRYRLVKLVSITMITSKQTLKLKSTRAKISLKRIRCMMSFMLTPRAHH